MSKSVLKLFLVSVVLALMSCAPKRVEVPAFEGMDFRDAIAARASISNIDTVFSVAFEKNDSVTRGDGALTMSRTGDMSLRIYSLGFLAMELTSRDGVVKSTPKIDRHKMLLLTEGLKDCLFWWDIKDYTVEDGDGFFLLRSDGRALWIDKKTLLPTRQKISFDDDRELNIFYDAPAKENGIWYQSKIRIEIPRYSVRLTLKKMSFGS